MKYSIRPKIFVSIGSLLVIGSVVITGYYISKIERVISKLETEILDANKKLSFDLEAMQRSYQHFFQAEIKLLILKTSPPSPGNSHALQEGAKGILDRILHGILERYVAATGEGPNDEELKELQLVAKRAVNGDRSAFSKLSDSLLLLQWKERRESTGTERDEKMREVEALKRKVDRCRYVSVTLQILGLIMVLLKDVASA